jgi:hypothetical protein
MTSTREWLNEYSERVMGDDPLLTMHNFDDCIVGVVHRFNDVFVVYSLPKVIAKLTLDGMTVEEAHEFWEFNQLGAWVGDHTPGFLVTPGDTE